MARVDDMIDEVIRGRGDMSMFMLILQGLVERSCRGLEWDPVIVELGVRSGNSTLSLLNAIEMIGRGKLYSVDIDPCEEAHSAVQEAGLYHHWYFHLGDSVEFYREIGSCDFIFIDTSHEYEQTMREIEVWGPMVRLGGVMVFHDTLSTDGVRRAIDEFLNIDGFQFRLWRRDDIDVGPGMTILTKRMMSNSDLDRNLR